MKKKKKEKIVVDKQILKLESLKFKSKLYETKCRYRLVKPLGKMVQDQLVELIQFQSQTTAKIQSIFDHSTMVISLDNLVDI